MEKVAIYIRVSKKEQSQDKGSDSSLNLQLKKCLDYCKEKKYKVLKVYSDVESGSSDERKSFIELSEAIPSEIYTKIIFWEVSRIARKMSTGMKFFEDLEKHKITFESVSEPFLKDFITLSLFLAMGTEALRQMSKRIRSNLFEKTKRGYFVHGRPARGYIRGENKMIIPDPEYAPWIKSIFETYAENYNLSETGRIFGKKRGDIVDIIDNRIYIGEVCYKKYVKDFDSKYRMRKLKSDVVWYKGLHEPIVPLELFERCQRIRNSNIKMMSTYTEYKSVLLFSGMVTCTCGHKMYQNKRNRIYKKTGKTYEYFSYLCKHIGCRKSFSRIKLETKIKQMIMESTELKTLNSIKPKEKNYEDEIKKLECQRQQVEKERDRILNLFQKGYINEQELGEKMSKVEEIKKKLQEKEKVYSLEKPRKLEEDLENLEKLKFIINNYTDEDVLEARKIFRLLIKEIKVINFKPLNIMIDFF